MAQFLVSKWWKFKLQHRILYEHRSSCRIVPSEPLKTNKIMLTAEAYVRYTMAQKTHGEYIVVFSRHNTAGTTAYRLKTNENFFIGVAFSP
jgi:hypothetical protein